MPVAPREGLRDEAAPERHDGEQEAEFLVAEAGVQRDGDNSCLRVIRRF